MGVRSEAAVEFSDWGVDVDDEFATEISGSRRSQILFTIETVPTALCRVAAVITMTVSVVLSTVLVDE